MKKITCLAALITSMILSGCSSDSTEETPNANTACDTSNIRPQTATTAELGRELFFDSNLSTPAGQSCADCHDPNSGFADPISAAALEPNTLPVSEGAITGRFGNRNAPTAAYASFTPVFAYIDDGIVEPHYIGGQFLDGREPDLAAQAKKPFLNPLEMANPSEAAVVEKVCAASYAGMFVYLFGQNAFDDVRAAYTNIAEAIAEFERSPEVNSFTSKYDYYLDNGLDPTTFFTASENRGRILFEDPNFDDKAKCKNCHSLEPVNGEILFTNFTYANIGVPKNPSNPFYSQATQFNPDQANFVDLGLGGILNQRNVANAAAENGKFKVPTLRNVELTAPYMHNGVFSTLTEVVQFYNERDAGPTTWDPAEVSANVNDAEMGDLMLTDQEVQDLVAFMKTLTDGYPYSP